MKKSGFEEIRTPQELEEMVELAQRQSRSEAGQIGHGQGILAMTEAAGQYVNDPRVQARIALVEARRQYGRFKDPLLKTIRENLEKKLGRRVSRREITQR